MQLKEIYTARINLTEVGGEKRRGGGGEEEGKLNYCALPKRANSR